jgi:hypothetical protein
MRSIFSKLAVAAFITIGFITQETQSVQIRNLVHAQRAEVNAHPLLFAEVHGPVTVQGSTTTATVPSKEAPKVTSQPASVSGPSPKPPTTTTTTPVANNQPAKTATTTPAAPVQAPPAKDAPKTTDTNKAPVSTTTTTV